MIVCPACGTTNPDDAPICSECQSLLNTSKLPKHETGFAERYTQSVGRIGADSPEMRKVTDIMFVFDCTGSMRGEIRAMQDAVMDFARSVTSDGLDIRLGLIEFRDRTIGEEHRLYTFSDGAFTKNLTVFQAAVDALRATGGGPEPESSPDAIMLALEQEFRDCPNKTVVLITDAPPRLPDRETNSYHQVIAKMEERDINQFYVVTMLQRPSCHTHLQLLEGVQKYGGDGLAFELSKNASARKEHFKKVLKGLAKSISTKSVTM